MKLLNIVLYGTILISTALGGSLQAKPAQLNASGVTDLDLSGGFLDSYFGLDNLTRIDPDALPLWTTQDSVTALSLTRWPGFIRGFGLVDADDIFTPLLDTHANQTADTAIPAGGVFSFGLLANPVPTSSALVPGDTYAQSTMQVWAVTGGTHTGGFLFTWENVVGGSPRNHHDLVILVSGAQIAPDLHPVPVPAALWLFGSGQLALFAWARRRAEPSRSTSSTRSWVERTPRNSFTSRR